MSKITPSFIRKMQYYAKRFNESRDSIWTAYGRPSDYKVKAYERLCEIANGGDCRVLGHNCNVFTTGMYTTDKETGELLFRVDTRDNVYTIPANYVEED